MIRQVIDFILNKKWESESISFARFICFPFFLKAYLLLEQVLLKYGQKMIIHYNYLLPDIFMAIFPPIHAIGI